jgi:class 3 adenylate cyclase
MSLADDLGSEVHKIFKEQWKPRSGVVVPDTNDVGLNNDGVEIDATVIYADLAESTALVDNNSAAFSAEIYKAYLYCAGKVIRAEGGEITAYDGDRVMAVFLGASKDSAATRAALKINHVVQKIINPALKADYPKKSYEVRQCVGVDTSKLLAARAGIRGANDLVWVGRAANHAAKLCGLRDGNFASWITAEVFNQLDVSIRVTNGQKMWEAREWTSMGKRLIYRSSWMWKP